MPADGIDKQLVWCVAEQLKHLKQRIWKSGVQALPVWLLPLIDKELYSTVALFTQVYKRVLPAFCWEGGWGGNPAMNILSRRE